MKITEIKTLRNKRMLYFHKLWGVFFCCKSFDGQIQGYIRLLLVFKLFLKVKYNQNIASQIQLTFISNQVYLFLLGSIQNTKPRRMLWAVLFTTNCRVVALHIRFERTYTVKLTTPMRSHETVSFHFTHDKVVLVP